MASRIASPTFAGLVDRKPVGAQVRPDADGDLGLAHRIAAALLFWVNCVLLLTPPALALLILTGAIK